MGTKRRADERRRERPGIEEATGAAETRESFTGAPDAVQHPGAGAGTFPDAADNETSGMNTSTGRGRGSGVAGGVAGGHGGTVVSDTNRAVGHERDASTTGGGVAVPFGRGSNLGGAEQGMGSGLQGMSGGTLGGLRADELPGVEQEQQPGLGGDTEQDQARDRAKAPGDASAASGSIREPAPRARRADDTESGTRSH